MIRSFDYIFLIVALVFSLSLNADSQDSLYNELSKTGADTSRIKIYLQLAELNKYNSDSLLKYVNKAQGIAEKIKSNKWLMESSQLFIGFAKISSDSAIAIWQSLYERMKQDNDINRMAVCYKGIGKAYLFNSLDSAMHYFLKSLALFQSINDSAGLFGVKTNLAIAYAKMNRLTEAIAVSKEVLTYFSRKGDLHRAGTAAINIGIYYEWSGDYKNAAYYIQESINYNRERHNSSGVAHGQSSLADIYVLEKKYDKANSIYQELIKAENQLEKSQIIHLGYAGLSNLAFIKEDWDEAIKYTKLSWQYSTKDLDKESEMNEFLSRCYAKKGDYKMAFDYYKNYMALRDSFASSDRLKKADELEAKYQNKEKQAQINLLNIQNSNHEKQKKISFVIAGLVLAVIGVVFFSIRQRQKLKSQLEKQGAIIDERQRISRELHDDLGAQLSTAKMFLNSMKTTNDLKNNQAMLENSLNLIDNTIGDLKEIMEDLQSSVLQEKGYIPATEELVSKINQLKQIHFSLSHYQSDKRLDRKTEHHLFRITQELINNSLKYAQAKNVSINLVKHDHKVVLMYEDDGCGFDIRKVKKGNGLLNIEVRCGSLGGKVEFDTSIGAGSRAVVEIPLSYAS